MSSLRSRHPYDLGRYRMQRHRRFYEAAVFGGVFDGAISGGFVLHLFSFKTPIFTAKKNKKKCKINSRNFTYDGLTFSTSFLLEVVKDEI